MSSKSNASTYHSAQAEKQKTSSTQGKQIIKSLREKVLTKTISRNSPLSMPLPSTSTAIPEDQVSPQEQTADSISRVEMWEQSDLPPRPINTDDEEETSDAMSGSSVCSEVSRINPSRKSLLFTTGRGTGIEMDVANKAANTMLQKGKEALEQAGNMKKECKLTALDALQSLYETVLSLSDSRSRHKYNLEKERSRHAQELVRIERAHNKQITTLTNEISKLRDTLDASLRETRDVRKWLEYETQEPHRQIKETHRLVPTLDTNLKTLTKTTSDLVKQTEKTSQKEPAENIKQEITELRNKLENLSKQLSRMEETSTKLHKENRNELKEIQSRTYTNTSTIPEELSTKISSIAAKLGDMENEIKKKTKTPTNIKEELEPISERLKLVTSELKSIREEKLELPPQPAISLETEMALAEIAKGHTKSVTYANVAKKPPPPPQRREQHSVIVFSTNTKDTSENTLKLIRTVLDSKTTGARVDNLRKVKNQKIVLSCSNKEDLNLITSRLKTCNQLKQEKARTNNPLLIIKDVLSYHSDPEIIEHLRAQNKAVFEGVKGSDNQVRIKYRKKARNAQECHVVLEVSPVLHKNFLNVGKVYIDLQRRPVEDQSPLIQCAKCLGYGHTKKICEEEKSRCSYCGDNSHDWENCRNRKENKTPTCYNCKTASKPSAPMDAAHTAFSKECLVRHKWDNIARSKISYLC